MPDLSTAKKKEKASHSQIQFENPLGRAINGGCVVAYSDQDSGGVTRDRGVGDVGRTESSLHRCQCHQFIQQVSTDSLVYAIHWDTKMSKTNF